MSPNLISAEGSRILAELFNRMPIKELAEAVPAGIQQEIGDFMFANGYRMVFNRWYKQAEPLGASDSANSNASASPASPSSTEGTPG